MATLFTSLRIATVLITAGLSTTSALAQQTAHRPVTAQRTTLAAKPKTTATKPATRAVQSVTSQTSASQVSSHSTVASAQPVASQTGSSSYTVRTTSLSQPVKATQTAGRAKYLNLGVGLAAYYGAGLPIGASLEVDLKDHISVGGSFDYLHYGGGYNFIYMGARGSYHLNDLLNVQNRKFDPYAGATLGFRHYGYDDAYGYDYGGYNSGLFLGIHLGARYYFGDKVGGFAELGYGVSALKAGVTVKF